MNILIILKELANKFKTEGKEFLEKEFSSYFSLIYPDVDPGMTELISAVKEKYFGNKTDSITVNTQLIKASLFVEPIR